MTLLEHLNLSNLLSLLLEAESHTQAVLCYFNDGFFSRWSQKFEFNLFDLLGNGLECLC